LVDGGAYRHRNWKIEEGERTIHFESFVEVLESAWSTFSEKLGRDLRSTPRLGARSRDPPLVGARVGRRPARVDCGE
jgi:hypothetical protein